MNNLWLQERKADADRIERLSAHAAANYVATLCHEDAAYVLAKAAVKPSAGVLRVLLSKDAALTMAILININPDKAQDLIRTIGSSAAWLESVPAAAEAIADRENELAGTSALGERVGSFSSADPSALGTKGFRQNFANGHLYWTTETGVQFVSGAIAQCHDACGGSGGQLGFPVSPERPTASSHGTNGSMQEFESGTVYCADRHEAYAICDAIGEFYDINGGCAGIPGFPIDEEADASRFLRDGGPGKVGRRQRFEGGVVYYSEKTKVLLVSPDIARYCEGNAPGKLGFPVSAELPAVSPFGTTGRLQRFESWRDYSQAARESWDPSDLPAGVVVYASEKYGVSGVGWEIGELHEKLGGSKSWLGFPQDDEVATSESYSSPAIQRFEGGAIFYHDDYGPIPVPASTLEFIDDRDGLMDRLGFPVKTEFILDDDHREQVFEYGLITVREGVREAWLRAPESTEDDEWADDPAPDFGSPAGMRDYAPRAAAPGFGSPAGMRDYAPRAAAPGMPPPPTRQPDRPTPTRQPAQAARKSASPQTGRQPAPPQAS